MVYVRGIEKIMVSLLPRKNCRAQVVMVLHDRMQQSYSDAKVSSIKNLWHANYAFVLFDANEIKGLDGNV